MTIKYLDSKRLSGSPISDIVQDTASISASSGAGSSLSHNITVANNSNRVLIACISTYGTKPSITGVTWNGSESMTAVPNSEAVDTNNRTQIYYLVNPTSGAHAINATFSASASSSGVAGISLYNVNQTTPVSAGNTNTGNVNNITVNITPTNVGSWIIGHLSSSSGIGSVSNLTEIYSVSAGALIRGGKNTSPVIGSANAIGWGTSSHTWALSGCEILRYGDIKPTNVQDNSIFVEKDTAKRFWFSEALAPTYGGNDITTDITWTQTIGSSTSDTFYILKDTGNDLMDIKAAGNCGTFANPSIGYATLGSTLSSSSWIVRFKLVFNTVTAESTGGKSFLTTFGVVDTATDWQDSENGFIFRFIADSGSAQTQFGSVTSGTVSTTSMSWTPATNNTIYVQIAYSSGTATANFYSDPEFLTGVGTANVTRSGTFSGIRYPQIAFLQDTGGNGVMEIDMKDLKIYNEATSIADATWTNPLENVGQIAQLSGSDAANSYTAASEFYSIPTDTWGSVFNIASGGRGRGGSAGTPTHCYLLGGQDGSKYYNEVDRIAWADKTQNATTMSGTRAWGNTVSNAVSVCVGQSFYYGSYSNSIDEFTYPTMTSTSQGNTSANFAFSGAFGNSSFGFVAKNATINKYTYSDKSNTNSSLATPPSPPNHAGHTGNSTVGMSINNSSASTNAKYDTYNIAANTWASNTVTSTTSYEDGRASGSTKYNLYSTQTNKSVARSCEKFNYGSGTLTSFTSVTTNLDGADGDAGASSNNTGVTS